MLNVDNNVSSENHKDEGSKFTFKTKNISSKNVQQVHDDLLWVEKYAPRSFTDLISPISINNEVLHWTRKFKNNSQGSYKSLDSKFNSSVHLK